MGSDPQAPKPTTQPTQPKKGEPVDIPVPERDEVERLLSKAAQPLPRPARSTDE